MIAGLAGGKAQAGASQCIATLEFADTLVQTSFRTVTDTSVTPNVARTWTYTYNSYGQVLTEDGPRTDATAPSSSTR